MTLLNQLPLVFGEGSFDIFQATNSAAQDLKTWIGQYAIVLGAFLIAVGIAALVMLVVRKQNRLMTLSTAVLAFMIGGFLLTTGYTRSENVANGLGETMEAWSQGDTKGDAFAGQK